MRQLNSAVVIAIDLYYSRDAASQTSTARMHGMQDGCGKQSPLPSDVTSSVSDALGKMQKIGYTIITYFA